MIIQSKDNVLEKSQDFKSQTFGIKNFNKAFRILIDGIYSDPYGSIIREITSNCIDANKESKTDKNVEITFVDKDALTGDDYTIIFKDYGVGISPDRMFNIFCFLGKVLKILIMSRLVDGVLEVRVLLNTQIHTLLKQ